MDPIAELAGGGEKHSKPARSDHRAASLQSAQQWNGPVHPCAKYIRCWQAISGRGFAVFLPVVVRARVR